MIQRIAAANSVLHCIGLLSAESAGWIPIKQAHRIQVPFYMKKARKAASCQSQAMHT
jgi:hypothetical protein